MGHTRAAILQRLEAPARAGQIAEAHYMLPGGTTYHLRYLEAAGLIGAGDCDRWRVEADTLVGQQARRSLAQPPAAGAWSW